MLDPLHVLPTAPLAERVLLPGDPGRALALAQVLLSEPKMFNHNRGLWGYTGEAADGGLLTIQSTGMGGPSAAIVISELVGLGARRFVRVGTCGALDPALALGDLVAATEAIVDDGTSRALGAGERVSGDAALLEALATGSVRTAPIVTTDLFYDGPPGRQQRWIDAGAVAVEMETATLFALAAARGVRAAALLTVSDLVGPPAVRIESDRLSAAAERMGRIALDALTA